ncbi:hypothetical protein Tco_1417503 [Tanacetum coccineum]
MEAHISPIQSIQVNKITSSCEIDSDPHDTQYCMENPEHAFVEYASSHTDKAGDKWYTFKPEQNNLGDTYNPSWKCHPNLSFNNQSNLEGLVSNFMESQKARFSKFEADFKQQQSEMTNKIDTILKAITDRIMGALPSDMPEEEEQEEKDDPENINTNPSLPPDPSVSFIIEKVRNFTYVIDFMIIEDISSIIDQGVSQDSLSDLEREHTKSVYLRNEEDKRRGVEYVMNKILGFYKACLKLGPEYLIGIASEREVTDIKEILGDITQRDIKEILGDTTQRDIKEILGDTTQRDIKEILGDTTQRDIEEILGDTTQRDIEEILGDTTQRDIEEILGDTTQRDISMYLGNNISG